jgi:hypothetical protein
VVDFTSAAILCVVLALPFLTKRIPDQAYVIAGGIIGIVLKH